MSHLRTHINNLELIHYDELLGSLGIKTLKW